MAMWDPTHSDCHDTPVPNSGDLVTDLVYPDPLGSLGPLTVFLSFSVLDCDSPSPSAWSRRVPVSVGKPQLPWRAHPLGVWAEGRWAVQHRLGVVVVSGRSQRFPDCDHSRDLG